MTRRVGSWAGWCVVALAATIPTTIAQEPPVTGAPPPAGVIVGTVTDASGVPLVGVKVQAVGRRQRWAGPYYEIPTGKQDETDDRGRFRLYFLPPGRYTVAVLAPTTPAGQPAPPSPTEHLRTYAPGTTSLADAVTVAVAPGAEQPLSVRVTPARFVTISGRATTFDGMAATDFDVWLERREGTLNYSGIQGGFATTMTSRARTAKDGAFTLSRVPSGTYTVTVTNGRTRRDQPFEIAEIPIAVDDKPMTNVAVRTARGTAVSGRLEWAGRGPAPWQRGTTTLGRIRATPIGRTVDFASVDTDVHPDGTFRFSSLYGSRRIEALSLPADWVIESVKKSDGPIAARNIDVMPGSDIGDLRVVVTNRTGTLNALVVDEENRPVARASLLLMPREAGELDALGWGFRVSQTNQRRNDDWLYTMDRVLPGLYLALAIDGAPFHLTADAELMERARAAATPIEIAEGNTSVRLRLVRVQP